MIRRSITLQNGRPGWLLIRQQTHALLAAELARCWISLPEFAPPDHHHDLLLAIAHHDDGWDMWDRHWYRHLADDGMPIAFHEMETADSNRIWDRSIELAQADGPLTTYIVARHFLRMRERSHDLSESSVSFLDRNQSLCDRSLQAWKGQHRPAPSEIERVEVAVDGLQFFDNLSLILCLGKVDEPVELTPPVRSAITLEFDGPEQISFRPNPFTTAALSWEVEALEVPGGGLDAKRLKRDVVPRQLSWRLTG